MAGRPDPGTPPFWRRLATDWVFLLGLVLLVAVSIPYLFPVLGEDAQWWLDNVFANLLLYGIGAVALRVGVNRVESRAERRFWFFLTLAILTVMLVYATWGVAEVIAPFHEPWAWLELFSQGCYLGFYLLAALAVDANRTVQEESVDQELRWLRAAGLGLFLVGLLAYFAVAPVLLYQSDPNAWISILLIYSSLDLLICLQALRLRNATSDRRWRGILVWVALVFGIFSVMDFTEAAEYAEWFRRDQLSLIGELQWFLPLVVLLVGGRIFLTTERQEPEQVNETPVSTAGGPLVIFAVALPLLHLVLTSLDLLDPDLQSLREVIVLCVMVLIGILAVAYERKVFRLRELARSDLEESRERYSTFVSTSVEGIWYLEFDPPISTQLPHQAQAAAILRTGRVVECNEAMAHMYGLPDSQALVGTKLRDLFGPIKDSQANGLAALRFVASGYRTVRETLEFERPDGSLSYFEGSVVGYVEGDHLVRAWATQVDVTARVVALEEKTRLEDQLRRSQRLETIGTLAGGIAHDFNNILAPILGFAELADGSLRPEEEGVRNSLRQIRMAANRGKDLVGQILAVGQKTKDVRRPISVGSVVVEAKRFLEQSLPSTIKFEVALQGQTPYAMADPAQVHQVVMNLCTNSSQAMVDQKGTIRIDVHSTLVEDIPEGWDAYPGEFVTLSVSDDGSGMPDEIRNRAFEPFFKGRDFAPGSGLGLSVTHGIVSGHNGFIELESEEGLGTTVRVFLPTAGSKPVEAKAPASDVVRSEEGAGLSGVQTELPSPVVGGASRDIDEPPLPETIEPLRILLVDDEEGVVETSTRMLERLGHSVVSLTDSTKALEILDSESDRFDVLVTDHTMPDITGPQLAAAAQERNPAMGIVVASGHRFGDDGGGQSSIVKLEKPFTMAELQASVERARLLTQV